MTAGTSFPVASVAFNTDGMSLIASVSAIKSKSPTTLETATAMTMLHGRDDRKRNREVGEAADRPEQLLRVAERAQLADIVARLPSFDRLHRVAL
jgi:hypothetical protein